MTILEAIILGLIQGLTEFIPVSSSGHLVLLHELFDINGGLLFDVALHIGTLSALALLFWKDIVMLTRGLLGRNEHQRMAWLIAAATVPAVVSGVLLQSAAESAFRSVKLVAFNLIVVAVLMLIAEYMYKRFNKPAQLKDINGKQALAMGAAQALAVIPGVSRSGSTITAGLFVGIDRVAATRFSFLLAIPITAGAILKVLISPEAAVAINGDAGVFIAGIIASFLSGLFAIRFMLKFLAGHTLKVFAYYRILLGLAVLVLAAFA